MSTGAQEQGVPVNRREIRVIGLSRSGNHAVVRWIASRTEGRVCFLNCCEGKQNPFESARALSSGAVTEASYAIDLERERRGEFSRKDLLIFNHEDSFLAHACSGVYEEHHDEWVGVSGERIDLLLLRDPFNLIASRRRRRGTLVKAPAAMRIWKQHAREFLGRGRRRNQRRVELSYNHWFADPDYRESVAAELGLAAGEGSIDRVADCFGGSSFDGMTFDGRARDMRVLERWRHDWDDPTFHATFDAQTVELARDIFGEMPQLAECFDRHPGTGSAVGKAG